MNEEPNKLVENLFDEFDQKMIVQDSSISMDIYSVNQPVHFMSQEEQQIYDEIKEQKNKQFYLLKQNKPPKPDDQLKLKDDIKSKDMSDT